MLNTAISWQFTPRKCPVFVGLCMSFVGCNAGSYHFNTNFFYGFLVIFDWKLCESRGKWRGNCNGWDGTVIEFEGEGLWKRWKSGNVKFGDFVLCSEGYKNRKSGRFISLVRENYFPSQRNFFFWSEKKFFLGREWNGGKKVWNEGRNGDFGNVIKMSIRMADFEWER